MLDISALFAEMRKPAIDEEATPEIQMGFADMLKAMAGEGALPELPDDDTGSLAEDNASRMKRRYARKKKQRLEDIVVLDFETDPFDNEHPENIVYPFLAVLYSTQFDPIVIWDDDHETLIEKTVAAIEALPGSQTIYAHNGGRFDYKFLIHKLRGEIKFKGSSIMSAEIGKHMLRDSLHILPTSLASLQKDAFDYRLMDRSIRHKHKDDIIQYCINDCKYALDFIRHFVERHGFKISIGQAAFAQVKSLYPQIECLSPGQDKIFRQFFFGGRVECFEGNVHVKGNLKYVDLNSAYPAVMAHMKHPIGKVWVTDNKVTRDTFFIELSCKSQGAFIIREKIDGDIKTSAPHGYRKFYTTIHEYKAAVELNLISDVTIHATHNCPLSTTFADFVVPRYDARRSITAAMKNELENSASWSHMNKDQTIIKFELNNAYGKFAQNPERYRETYITNVDGKPPEDDGLPWRIETIGGDYIMWQRPNADYRYNNVATGASITGAQRAVLLRAIHAVKRPLYCDTDSVICEDVGDLEMHDTKLGAWKIEAELDELIVNGKKLYAYHNSKKDKWTIRSKGASGLTLDNMKAINIGESILVKQKGITLRNDGTQYYNARTVRATGLSERIRADGSFVWESNPTFNAHVPETGRPARIADEYPA